MTNRYNYNGLTLSQAIDAVKAFDNGAFDSGIHDESMKESIINYLKLLSENEKNSQISSVCIDMLNNGYTLYDLVEFSEWLKDSGID